MRLPITLAFLVALPGAACINIGERLAPTRDVVVLTQRPDPVYEELFPAYAELCAVSQYRPKDREVGGSPGHGVMYLKGACLDEDAAYPRLAPCAETAADAGDASHGTGISVNKWFKNVNWVGIPGKRLFFHGNLKRGQRLTQEHFDATVQAALPYYRGVETHPHPQAPDWSVADFVAQDSIGTDFALRYGRSVYCMRLPVTRPMMAQIIEFLNELNDDYADGETDYNWSGFHDNCVHTLRNALAAAKIWEPKKVWTIKVRQFFNLAIPANEFMNLATLAHDSPLENFPEIYTDDLKRETLLEQSWLPMTPGAMIKSMSIHQDNDLYDTRFRMLIVQSPFLSRVTKRADRLLYDARFVELEANLRLFRARYESILAHRGDTAGWWSRGDEDYLAAREHYYGYIEAQKAEVDRMLARLAEQKEEY